MKTSLERIIGAGQDMMEDPGQVAFAAIVIAALFWLLIGLILTLSIKSAVEIYPSRYPNS